ncbi:MAG: hypothetical protein ICV76_01715 [Nitrospiraceae bacterium]|nr:hypothetical protein [Nitrospiraceae bacterium]
MMVRGGNLQPPEQWRPQSTTEKKSINLTVTAKASSQQPSNAKVLQLLEGQSQKAYMESGLFSHVAVSKEPTDLRAEVKIIEEGSEALASISGFISGFTFGIIPGYAKENVIMVTTFRDQAGKELGSIRKSETLSFWIQLFLVAVMPFREEPQAIVRDTYHDLNRATLDQARPTDS